MFEIAGGQLRGSIGVLRRVCESTSPFTQQGTNQTRPKRNSPNPTNQLTKPNPNVQNSFETRKNGRDSAQPKVGFWKELLRGLLVLHRTKSLKQSNWVWVRSLTVLSDRDLHASSFCTVSSIYLSYSKHARTRTASAPSRTTTKKQVRAPRPVSEFAKIHFAVQMRTVPCGMRKLHPSCFALRLACGSKSTTGLIPSPSSRYATNRHRHAINIR